MSVGDDARRIEHDARELYAQARRAIGRILDPWADTKALFFGDDGKLTPAAASWLDRLARDNFVDRTAFHHDAREHARREGRREVVTEIFRSLHLDTRKLAQLRQAERELGNER